MSVPHTGITFAPRADFFTALFTGGAGVLELRALPSKARVFVAPADDAGIGRFAQAHAGENLYFGVASRRDATSGALENCQHLGALFVDIDFKATPEPEARDRLARFPLRPSCMILSGGGLHVYFSLRHPLTLPNEAEQAKSLLRRLAVALGGDLAAAEPARVLRLPGSVNHKYNPPRLVTLELLELARRYTPSDVDEILPGEPEPERGPQFQMPAIVEPGARNATLYRLGRALRATGLSESALIDALLAENRGRCRPPLPEGEVRDLAHHVAEQPDRADFQAAGAAKPEGAWARARPVTDFINDPEAGATWHKEPIIAPGSVTEMFSPRGLGKTHVAYAMAVELARSRLRILLLDRDNSRREVRRRLRAWGADRTPTFKVMLRDDVPPLTDTATWAMFPFRDYDLVIIDSLDASTEGVGEKDSSKPSKAIAPILDIAHRADGPAILVLGNTIKSAQHSRGSGVVEDRADLVYEVRDATDLRPTGTKPWWQELPPAGADAWAERASRRKRRDTYRLAFVNTKCRIGEEPDPFVFEIDLTTEPWVLRSVTAELVQIGIDTRAQAARERHDALLRGTEGLRAEVETRADPLTAQEAVGFLTDGYGLKRAEARQVIQAETGKLWSLEIDTSQRGRPKFLRPIKSGSAAETPQSETPLLTRSGETAISADRINSGRQKSGVLQPAPIEAISQQAFRPPSGLEEAADGRDEGVI